MEPTYEKKITGRDVLKIRMGKNDAGAETIGDYLRCLLRKLWLNPIMFNAKRPFGNGHWTHEIAIPLIKAGVVPGRLDSDGFVEQLDDSALDAVMVDAIDVLTDIGRSE